MLPSPSGANTCWLAKQLITTDHHMAHHLTQYFLSVAELSCPWRRPLLGLFITLLWCDEDQALVLQNTQRNAWRNPDPASYEGGDMSAPHAKMGTLAPWVKYRGLGWMIPEVYRMVASRHVYSLLLSAEQLFGVEMHKQYRLHRLPRVAGLTCFQEAPPLFDAESVWAGLIKGADRVGYSAGKALAKTEIVNGVFSDPTKAKEYAVDICKAIKTKFNINP